MEHLEFVLPQHGDNGNANDGHDDDNDDEADEGEWRVCEILNMQITKYISIMHLWWTCIQIQLLEKCAPDYDIIMYVHTAYVRASLFLEISILLQSFYVCIKSFHILVRPLLINQAVSVTSHIL